MWQSQNKHSGNLLLLVHFAMLPNSVTVPSSDSLLGLNNLKEILTMPTSGYMWRISHEIFFILFVLFKIVTVMRNLVSEHLRLKVILGRHDINFWASTSTCSHMNTHVCIYTWKRRGGGRRGHSPLLTRQGTAVLCVFSPGWWWTTFLLAHFPALIFSLIFLITKFFKFNISQNYLEISISICICNTDNMKFPIHCWPTGELIFILLDEINLEPEKKVTKWEA